MNAATQASYLCDGLHHTGLNSGPRVFSVLLFLFSSRPSIKGPSPVAEREWDWVRLIVTQAPPALSVSRPFSCSPAWQGGGGEGRCRCR